MLYDVRKDDKWGYIDSSGAVIYPVEATSCIIYSEGLGGVFYDTDLQITDETGSVVGGCKNVDVLAAAFSGGLLSVLDLRAELHGYVNRSGEWVIPPRFASARDFEDKRVAIAVNEARKEGIIDREGRWVQEPTCHRIFSFGSDTASATAFKHFPGDRKGSLRTFLIDERGKQVGNEFYDHGRGGAEGLLPVKRDSKWGVVNEDGTLVIPFAFEEINPFSEGLAPAQDGNGRWGAIDRNGHWAIHPTFAWIEQFSEGIVPGCGTGRHDSEMGLYRQRGKVGN